MKARRILSQAFKAGLTNRLVLASTAPLVLALSISVAPRAVAQQVTLSGDTNPATVAGILPDSDLTIGDASAGSMSVTGGGKVTNASSSIGLGAKGDVLVSGAGSSWENSGRLNVGLFGPGSLRIEDGARVMNGLGIVGGGDRGDVVVTGAGSTWVNRDALAVGNHGIGTMIVENGATVTSSQGFVGGGGPATASATDGTVTVTGPGSSWSTRFNIAIGNYGTGTLIIEDGGRVRADGGTSLGTWAGDSGTLTVSGTAAARGVFETTFIGGGGGTANVTIDGGIVRALQSTSDFVRNFGAQVVNIDAGGAIIDTNGYDIAIAAGLAGGGGLTKISAGTLTLSGLNNTYIGATTVTSGTLAAGATNTFSVGSAHTILAGSTLALNGFNQTVAALDNAGLITFGSAPGTRLTVTGNYVGNGGTLNVNTRLGGDASATDRLVVNGDISGASNVRVTNVGGGGAQTVEGIKVIDVVGVSNGTFSLTGDYAFHGQQAVIGGAYAYTLQKNGIASPADGDWYLRSSLMNPPLVAPSGPIYQPGVPLYEAMPQVLHALNSLPTLQQRVGYRYSDTTAVGTAPASSGGGATTEPNAFWGRTEGSYNSFKPTSSTTLSSASIGQWKARTGLDGQLYANQNGTLIGGVTAHFGTAIADIRSKYGDGRINATGTGFGGTLTWYGENGYIDGQAQATFFNSNLRSNLVGRDIASGIGGTAYAMSVETGKRFDIAGPWALTPQAQLVYSAVDSDFNDSFGTRVSLGRSDSLNGRLGMALDHQNNWRDARGELTRTNIYGITNVYYEFLGGTRVDVAGTSFTSSNEKLAAGFGLGGTYNWGNDKYTVYGEALVKISFNDDYSVGGTGGFRMKW